MKNWQNQRRFRLPTTHTHTHAQALHTDHHTIYNTHLHSPPGRGPVDLGWIINGSRSIKREKICTQRIRETSKSRFFRGFVQLERGNAITHLKLNCNEICKDANDYDCYGSERTKQNETKEEEPK